MPERDRAPPIPADPSRVRPIDDPASYAGEARLNDGTLVHLRPIEPTDKAALQAGLKRLSRDSVYRRFFSPKRSLSGKELAYLTELDFHGHVALVATVAYDDVDLEVDPVDTARPDDERQDPPAVPEDVRDGRLLVGVGRYVVLDAPDKAPPRAELAITVADPFQHRGLGGILFDQLCAMAGEQGIETFVGTVMEGNLSMRRLLESHGRIVDEAWDGDGVRMTVSLEDCQGRT